MYTLTALLHVCVFVLLPAKNMTEIKRRVKVFSFGDRNTWEDIGTGFVSKDYIEVTRGELLTITVRSEYDNSIIIHSKVLPERSYKMQEVEI